MTGRKTSTALQMEQLIEQAKTLRPVSPATRARVLKRVQASALAGAALWISEQPALLKGKWHKGWLGGAASATLLAGAAALALNGREKPATTLHRPDVTASPVVPSAPLEPASAASSTPAQSQSTPTAPSAVEPSAARQPGRGSQSNAPELELLRRAHGAYGSGDFANALRLLAEHGRRFPNGSLAEEREALRVRALSGSGQSDSARRAARAFASKFPRSVLLSRTMTAADAGE